MLSHIKPGAPPCWAFSFLNLLSWGKKKKYFRFDLCRTEIVQQFPSLQFFFWRLGLQTKKQMVDFCVFGRHENVEELLGLARKRQKLIEQLKPVTVTCSFMQVTRSWLESIKLNKAEMSQLQKPLQGMIRNYIWHFSHFILFLKIEYGRHSFKLVYLHPSRFSVTKHSFVLFSIS